MANYLEDQQCTICLSPIQSQTQQIKTLPCKHQFHIECINQWDNTSKKRRQKTRCPNCREDMKQVETPPLDSERRLIPEGRGELGGEQQLRNEGIMEEIQNDEQRQVRQMDCLSKLIVGSFAFLMLVLYGFATYLWIYSLHDLLTDNNLKLIDIGLQAKGVIAIGVSTTGILSIGAVNSYGLITICPIFSLGALFSLSLVWSQSFLVGVGLFTVSWYSILSCCSLNIWSSINYCFSFNFLSPFCYPERSHFCSSKTQASS